MDGINYIKKVEKNFQWHFPVWWKIIKSLIFRKIQTTPQPLAAHSDRCFLKYAGDNPPPHTHIHTHTPVTAVMVIVLCGVEKTEWGKWIVGTVFSAEGLQDPVKWCVIIKMTQYPKKRIHPGSGMPAVLPWSLPVADV